ncbi:MAG TPA: hypothetical protein VGN37_08730 [Actinocatenispora sp.]
MYQWKAAKLPGGAAATFATPRFLADDRLMVAAHDMNGALVSSWAVDAKNTTAAPVKQPTTSATWDAKGRHAVWQLQQPLTDQPGIAGQSMYVDLLRSSTSVVSARVTSADGSFVPYRCDEQVDATRLLCMADLRLARLRGYTPPEGSVATLTLEPPEIGGAVLTTAVGTLPDHAQPAEREEIQAVYQSPDRADLLVATDRGWYARTGSAAPRYAFAHLGDTPAYPENAVVLGWAPTHYVAP